VEWWSGGVVEWWSGGVVEWWSGGVVEWWSGGVVEWRSGGVAEWLSTLAHFCSDRREIRRPSRIYYSILRFKCNIGSCQGQLSVVSRSLRRPQTSRCRSEVFTTRACMRRFLKPPAATCEGTKHFEKPSATVAQGKRSAWSCKPYCVAKGGTPCSLITGGGFHFPVRASDFGA
jgi:hypothetical protein